MIWGYFWTGMNYVFYCCSRFFRKKEMMLTFDLLAKLSVIIAYYLFGSLGGSYSMMVSFCILIAANIKVRLDRRWPVLYAIFEGALIFILIRQFAGLSSVLVFITATLSLLSIWWLKPQAMRIVGLITTCCSMAFMLSIGNWMGLLEIFVIASNVMSYIKYRKNK